MGGIEFDITVADNATAVLDQIANKLADINDGMDRSKTEMEELIKTQTTFSETTKKTNDGLQQQQLNAIGALTAINTLSSGVRLLSLSVMRLNFLGEENKQTIMNLIAAFQLLAGVSSIIKAITLASKAMGQAELGLAVIETYRAVLNSPWKAALVGVGIGAAAGVAGYMAFGGGNSNTNNNTNYNIYYGSPNPGQDANNRVVTQVIQGDRI